MYECFPKGLNMTKITRTIILLILCLFFGANLVLPVFAEGENQQSILCISHRGDSAEFESNTPEAVMSAFGKGAHFVSINIRKSADNELLLCNENETEIKGVTLKEMISLLDEDDVLILDFETGLQDEIYSLIEEENAFNSVMLRINDSAKNIAGWLKDKNVNLQVIGVYDSFVVFTAMSHIKTLSDEGMKFVQYQSKNYFNEMFGSFVSKKLKAETDTKAIALTYDPDLCGQRSDSEDGWNDLIKKGFSVIETNNLSAFISYVEANKNIRIELAAACKKAETIEIEKYNNVSRENLEDAINTAKELLNREVVSSDEMQSSLSAIRLAVENLAFKTGEDTQKGALNITAGKVIAAVLVGAVILAAQVYTYKMQKGKKK